MGFIGRDTYRGFANRRKTKTDHVLNQGFVLKNNQKGLKMHENINQIIFLAKMARMAKEVHNLKTAKGVCYLYFMSNGFRSATGATIRDWAIDNGLDSYDRATISTASWQLRQTVGL